MNETRSFDRPFLSHLEGLQDRIQRAYYAIIGDYLGVGFQVSCKAYIEETLNNVSQFDQAGWQAATTLMALTPVLLTFGNLFVAVSLLSLFCWSYLKYHIDDYLAKLRSIWHQLFDRHYVCCLQSRPTSTINIGNTRQAAHQCLNLQLLRSTEHINLRQTHKATT